MSFNGAVIKEQGVTFAIAVVRESVLNSPSDRDSAVVQFSQYFGVPTVIMAQDSRGTPKYFGRRDIVNFLSNVPPSRIPWRRYDFTWRLQEVAVHERPELNDAMSGLSYGWFT